MPLTQAGGVAVNFALTWKLGTLRLSLPSFHVGLLVLGVCPAAERKAPLSLVQRNHETQGTSNVLRSYMSPSPVHADPNPRLP